MGKYHGRSGWFKQHIRHVRAAKKGKAGGQYAAYGTTSKSAIHFLKGKKDVITGKPLRISKETRKAVEVDNWRYPKNVFSDKQKLQNKSFSQLKKEGVSLPYWGDADKDGTPNIKDCKPLNPKKQDFIQKKYDDKGYLIEIVNHNGTKEDVNISQGKHKGFTASYDKPPYKEIAYSNHAEKLGLKLAKEGHKKVIFRD